VSALVLTLAVLAGWAAGAQAASAATLTVRTAHGATRVVELGPLLAAPDVRGRTYEVRGGRAGSRTVTGVSLAAALRAVQLDVDAFRFAEVGDGTRAVLLPRAVALRTAGGDAPPPVLVADEDGVRLLRPSAGPRDRNGADELAAADLTVVLRRRARLGVRVIPSDPTPAPGDRVTFTARVDGVAAGETATVTWLVDGRGATGTRVTRRLSDRRRVRVLATVTTEDDPVGASSVLTLRVGGREPETTDARSPSPSPSLGSGAGPGSGSGSGTGSGGAGGGEGGMSPGTAASPAPPERPLPTATPSSRSAGTRIPGEVAGELLETPRVAAPPSAPTATPVPDAAPHRAGLPPEAWTGLGALALLGFGAGLERARWRRP